jgi:hypothetical protein
MMVSLILGQPLNRRHERIHAEQRKAGNEFYELYSALFENQSFSTAKTLVFKATAVGAK